MVSRKVLIIDENHEMRTQLRTLLPKGNYEIQEAGDGEEGLSLIYQEGALIRFIILEVNLPQLNGWELIERTQGDRTLEHIPMVLIGRNTTPPEGLVLDSRPIVLLEKPFSKGQLKAAVKSAVHQAKALKTASRQEHPPDDTPTPSEEVMVMPPPPVITEEINTSSDGFDFDFDLPETPLESPPSALDSVVLPPEVPLTEPETPNFDDPDHPFGELEQFGDFMAQFPQELSGFGSELAPDELAELAALARRSLDLEFGSEDSEDDDPNVTPLDNYTTSEEDTGAVPTPTPDHPFTPSPHLLETDSTPGEFANPFAGDNDSLSAPGLEEIPDDLFSPFDEENDVLDLDEVGSDFADSVLTNEPFSGQDLGDSKALNFNPLDSDQTIVEDQQPLPADFLNLPLEEEEAEESTRKTGIGITFDADGVEVNFGNVEIESTEGFSLSPEEEEAEEESYGVHDIVLEEDTQTNRQSTLIQSQVTLGGLDDLMMRWQSAIEAERLGALRDAFNYGEEGYRLVINAVKEESGIIQETAEKLIIENLKNPQRYLPMVIEQSDWLQMECIHTLVGHTYWVQALTLTPDGRYAVSGSKDSTIRIWDILTGREVRTLVGHESAVLSIAVTPEGDRIVSSSTDDTIKIWEFDSGEEIRTISSDSHKIYALTVSPDGKTVVSASAENTIKPTFDFSLEEMLSRLPMQSVPLVLFILTLLRRTPAIKIWDLDSGEEKGSLMGYSRGVTDLVISPKGDRVVSGSRDQTLKIWDLKSGKFLNTLLGHTDEIRSVCITPNGENIISGSRDRTIKIWDLKTGHVLRTLRGHNQSVTSVAISGDGKTIISGSRDNTVKIWDFQTGQYIHTLMGHTDLVRAVAVSSNGKTIVSGGRDNTIKVWKYISHS
ncbi:response regulator [Spirulina subsalsa FACHB-351]|uniref:Response regulator n=1 Tax=Spirulina subsalsa FACHB-351 TaxID=234711 RepID=A0ABT3L4Q6_9CYAN|nr:response regulator [Spirulina subsalsa]MCW6036177.1 response regulator [Spirulina subsalsa FACHB-351]